MNFGGRVGDKNQLWVSSDHSRAPTICQDTKTTYYFLREVRVLGADQMMTAATLSAIILTWLVGRVQGSDHSVADNMGKGAGSGGQQAKAKGVRKITLTELSEHRTKESAWMSYHGKVHLSRNRKHIGINALFRTHLN